MFAQGQSALAGEFPLNSETAPLDFVKDNQKTDNSPKLTLKDVNLTRETACATGFAVDINELYTLTPATAEDYDYKTDTINADGTVTTNYYKITLNPENAGSSENIKWTQTDAAGANTIAVTLPNNETAYLQYSYTAPDGYTTTGTRVTSPSSANSTKMVFSGINNAKSYTGSNDYGSDDTSYGSDVNKSGSDDIKSVTTLQQHPHIPLLVEMPAPVQMLMLPVVLLRPFMAEQSLIQTPLQSILPLILMVIVLLRMLPVEMLTAVLQKLMQGIQLFMAERHRLP